MTDPIRNPSKARSFESIAAERYSRRDMLHAGAKLGLAAILASALAPTKAFAQEIAPQIPSAQPALSPSNLTFEEIAKSTSITHHVASGYDLNLLIRWGDKLFADAPAFDPLNQTAAAQVKQFGFNNDFLAFMPFPQGSNSSTHGLLCANHEYTNAKSMFPEGTGELTAEQIDVEMAAHGHAIVEIQREGDQWKPVIGSPYNRRISALETDMELRGPVRGHARAKTVADPKGTLVRGTFGNCAGGVTPWGTVLVAEENFDGYFSGFTEDAKEAANHKRYGVGEDVWYDWYRTHPRFDVTKDPHEPNRFGWVVEYDPYDPKRIPVKRTTLGRIKHETATCALTKDGRVAVYTGDDEKFEYLYRFVSRDKFDAKNRKNNVDLLDNGILSVAKFHADGTMDWLPLVFGKNGLTAENGFNDQGDVLIETRRAADILGATPMDRPEGIAIQPNTAHVFVAMTNNTSRKPEQVNPANTRAANKHGHIVALMPPAGDHGAAKFHWQFFLEGGDPAVAADGSRYHGTTSENGWLSCPDNLAIDPTGNLWIATDGQPKTIDKNDGLYAAPTEGEGYGIPKLFFSSPVGAEVTGPCFTPDGETLFVSVQHPGDGSSFADPSTRWPDFRDGMPPRPSVVAITKTGGGRIGS